MINAQNIVYDSFCIRFKRKSWPRTDHFGRWSHCQQGFYCDRYELWLTWVMIYTGQSSLSVVNLLWKNNANLFFGTVCVPNSPQFFNYNLLQWSLNDHFMPSFNWQVVVLRLKIIRPAIYSQKTILNDRLTSHLFVQNAIIHRFGLKKVRDAFLLYITPYSA